MPSNLRILDADQADQEPARDWLMRTLRASRVTSCPSCCCGSICVPHAADAILDAARREDLFILPAGAADAVIEAAREQGRAEVRRG